jgi:hypothetical protein
MNEFSEIVLHHHLHFDEKYDYSFAFMDDAIRLHLADRIDAVLLESAEDAQVIDFIMRHSGTWFDPKDIQLFLDADQKYHILQLDIPFPRTDGSNGMYHFSISLKVLWFLIAFQPMTSL